MRNKIGNAGLLKRAVSNALASIGIKESEITFKGNQIGVASCGLIIKAALDNGKRVWSAESTYSVMRMEDAFETEITSQLFTVPLEDEILLARKIAVYVAGIKIDASIDAVLVEASGTMQR